MKSNHNLKTFKLLKNINQSGGDAQAALLYLFFVIIVGLIGYIFYQYKSIYIYGSDGDYIYRYNMLLGEQYGKWIKITESLESMDLILKKILSLQVIGDTIYATNGHVILSHGLHSGVKIGNWEPISPVGTINQFQIIGNTIYICNGVQVFKTGLKDGINGKWVQISPGAIKNFQITGNIIYGCNGSFVYKYKIGSPENVSWTQLTEAAAINFKVVGDFIYGNNGNHIYLHGLNSGVKGGNWEQLTGGNLKIQNFDIVGQYMYALIDNRIYRHVLDVGLNQNNWISMANKAVTINTFHIVENDKILGIQLKKREEEQN